MTRNVIKTLLLATRASSSGDSTDMNDLQQKTPGSVDESAPPDLVGSKPWTPCCPVRSLGYPDSRADFCQPPVIVPAPKGHSRWSQQRGHIKRQALRAEYSDDSSDTLMCRVALGSTVSQQIFLLTLEVPV